MKSTSHCEAAVKKCIDKAISENFKELEPTNNINIERVENGFLVQHFTSHGYLIRKRVYGLYEFPELITHLSNIVQELKTR